MVTPLGIQYTQYPLIRNDVKLRLVRFLIFPKFFTDFVSYFSHIIQSSFLIFFLILYTRFLNFPKFFKIYVWFARKKFAVQNWTLKSQNLKDEMGKGYLDPLSTPFVSCGFCDYMHSKIRYFLQSFPNSISPNSLL